MKQVIGFGALNVDNIFKVDNLLLEENAAYPADVRPGGSAANTTVALATLGVSCGFVGIVADDIYGKLLISDFKNRKVATKHVQVKKPQDILSATGSVDVFLDKKGRRLLFVKPGINSLLTLNNSDIKYLQNSYIIHISAFVDDKQLEIQKKIIGKIPQSVKISFSPGSLYASRGLAGISQLISRSFIIFLNKKEAYQLTHKNYKIAAKILLTLGPKVIVVTLEKDGCYVATKKKSFYSNTRKVNVVDTTGAGDAFSAGFLYGMLNNYNVEKCAEIGNAVASFAIQKIGARTGLPSRKELNTVVSFKK